MNEQKVNFQKLLQILKTHRKLC